jgi:hypothetical protein
LICDVVVLIIDEVELKFNKVSLFTLTGSCNVVWFDEAIVELDTKVVLTVGASVDVPFNVNEVPLTAMFAVPFTGPIVRLDTRGNVPLRTGNNVMLDGLLVAFTGPIVRMDIRGNVPLRTGNNVRLVALVAFTDPIVRLDTKGNVPLRTGNNVMLDGLLVALSVAFKTAANVPFNKGRFVVPFRFGKVKFTADNVVTFNNTPPTRLVAFAKVVFITAAGVLLPIELGLIVVRTCPRDETIY